MLGEASGFSLIAEREFCQNVNRATSWPVRGLVPAPFRVLTKPKPPDNAPAVEPGTGKGLKLDAPVRLFVPVPTAGIE